VDVTFGEFLRAALTADFDLVLDDDRRYRTVFVDAFRKWGIYAAGSGTLLERNLIWEAPEGDPLPGITEALRLSNWADWSGGMDRERIYLERTTAAAALHDWVAEQKLPDGGRSLGLCLEDQCAPMSIRRRKKDRKPIFEIHQIRPCRRVGPDGQLRKDLVIDVVQRRKASFDAATQAKMDASKPEEWGGMPFDFMFRGGCTLVVDGATGQIRYAIRKRINNERRLAAEREFRRTGKFAGEGHSLRALHAYC
jgi:hypothetical protein